MDGRCGLGPCVHIGAGRDEHLNGRAAAADRSEIKRRKVVHAARSCHVGFRLQLSLDLVEPAKDKRGEKVDRRPASGQVLDDRPVPHLRRRLDRGLVPGGFCIQQLGVLVE